MDYYAADLLDESRHPSNFVEWGVEPEQQCHNASCGDTLAVRFQVHNGRVVNLEWHGHGCALSMAAASVLSRNLEGDEVARVAQFSFDDVQRTLHLDEISLGRIKCVTLFLHCLQRQLEKNAETTEGQV